MPQLPLVVVGASAGGIPVLKTLLSRLPRDFPAAVLIVLHVARDFPSLLPDILDGVGPLPVRHPLDGESMQPGQVYVAPPDHHLIVEDDHVALTKGPKENHARPSINALFRSAAYLYGPSVIGVVLSGMLDDGVSGLYAIKRRGGQAVVQSPQDAEFNAMPLNALQEVEVDYVVAAQDMAPLLTALVREMPGGQNRMDERENQRLEIEVGIARGENALQLGVTELGAPSLLTCPECHGALVQFKEAGILRFRCHTGHGYSGSSLLSEITLELENKAYETLRVLEESLILMKRLGELCEQRGDLVGAEAFYNKIRKVGERTATIQALAQGTERLSGQQVEMRASDD
ncbi:chemotaxis protein CheB [Deinococcus humi]|uniref:protein-glutamate methylesterase n=1 Tax=Deinococcus humi TaxID=662880 RepID=A0A7W8NHF3_9DEIO|nr:chemotaxis protein CheB [Deinococcus humi]MBB5363947.1 two-component system chemotaxis response regulator CheB [Deinococcus humi]